MKKEQAEYLLEKFYKGETSEAEEKLLKEEISGTADESPEKDYFTFTTVESNIPDNLEEEAFRLLDQKIESGRIIRRRIYAFASMAAVLVVVFSIFFDLRETKRQKMEDDFFVMEHALFRVSETLKPEKQEDMFVLWVDNNVEIIVK